MGPCFSPLSTTVHPAPRIGRCGRYLKRDGPVTQSLYKCEALLRAMALLQLKDPSELFLKRRVLLPGSRFLSRRDMTLKLLKVMQNHISFFLMHVIISFAAEEAGQLCQEERHNITYYASWILQEKAKLLFHLPCVSILCLLSGEVSICRVISPPNAD